VVIKAVARVSDTGMGFDGWCRTDGGERGRQAVCAFLDFLSHLPYVAFLPVLSVGFVHKKRAALQNRRTFLRVLSTGRLIERPPGGRNSCSRTRDTTADRYYRYNLDYRMHTSSHDYYSEYSF
jgi:hypothetical protein